MKIAEVMQSILSATSRGHNVTYCEVSPEEYSEMRREQNQINPWCYSLTICGIPIRVRYNSVS